MNSYQRYINVLQGQPVDFLPRLPVLMAFGAEYIGSNYGAFASDYRVLVEANRRCVQDFDFDQISVISDPFRETSGFGAKVEYVEDGVPRCPVRPLQNDKNLDQLVTPDPKSSERMLDRVNGVAGLAEFGKGEYSILGWVEGPAAEAADLRDVTNFLMDLFDDPDYAGELMDRCVDVGIEFAKAQIEAGADTIGVGDAIASQVSPDVFKQYIMPRERRLFEGIRKAGAYVRLHICGNITHLLPMLAELPIDIVDCDWMVDMAEARRVLGSKVLAGNIDPANAVLHGTPESIKNAIRGIYNTVGNPYMVGAGCEIPPGTPNENLKALCEPVEYKAGS